MRKLMFLAVPTVLAAFLLSGCEEAATKTTGQKAEDHSRQSNYDNLIEQQPSHNMKYSPTRATKNFWIDTWGQKGALSYVYLRDASSNVFGYYVFEGLPVSYCVSLIPPYQVIRVDGGEYDSDTVVPGPSIDGTFSSSSNCNEVYGKDAVSGAYIEYSLGMGINQQISNHPMAQYGDADPLGDATLNKVR